VQNIVPRRVEKEQKNPAFLPETQSPLQKLSVQLRSLTPKKNQIKAV